MDEEEKEARELVDSYYKILHLDSNDKFALTQAKQCALIAVELILKTVPFNSPFRTYWNKVKLEIEKL